MNRAGPLSHLTVIEFAGLGPAPFAGMMLADMGARVIRIERPVKPSGKQEGMKGGMTALMARKSDVLARGRESVFLDLKSAFGKEAALRLVERADVLIEGFRPGVMESLGLGPNDCLQRRPSLVYGRVTGWGQTGPLAQAAGHDIDFIALTGALHHGAPGRGPDTPARLIGDFGGGGMLLAFGVVCAALEAARSGQGQTIDASICDGSALLAALVHGWRSAGLWNAEARHQQWSTAARTSMMPTVRRWPATSPSRRWSRSSTRCCARNATSPTRLSMPVGPVRWPAQKAQVAARVQAQDARRMVRATRRQRCVFRAGAQPGRSAAASAQKARGTFATVDGITQPSPAPRFSRTPAAACRPVGEPGAETRSVLQECGTTEDEIAR